jgi:DNA-binding response OmpR family regulator/predicted transcriptional regulator
MSAVELSEESVRSESPGKLGQLGEALVLLVDSDPSSAEFVARALTQSEMRVVISDRISGAGGASMQLRSHPEIGVVVIDPQTVPGRDNLAELREAGLAEDVQVILVAEPVILGRYAQSARGEVADFLPKPVARRTLLRAVIEAQKRHLSQRDVRIKDTDQAHEAQIERLIERTTLASTRRTPIREPSSELRLLQLVEDIDECRTGALTGILEPDASWSMLTELLRARLSRRRVSVTSLCLASKSPVTTALRRIERLLETGLVSCTQDPKDRRRKYIELTDEGTTRLVAALRAVSERVRGE